MPKSSAKSPPRFERVIDDAEALFVHEGFLHLSTDEVARRLRCSKQTLYAIAPTREKFFELIVERYFLRLNQEIAIAAAAAPDCVKALRAYIRRAEELIGDETAKFREDALMFPEGRRVINRTERERLAAIANLVKDGIASGLFRRVNPDLVATGFVAAVRRVTEPAFLSRSTLSYSQAIDQTLAIYLKGILKEQGAGASRDDKAAGPTRNGAGHSRLERSDARGARIPDSVKVSG